MFECVILENMSLTIRPYPKLCGTSHSHRLLVQGFEGEPQHFFPTGGRTQGFILSPFYFESGSYCCPGWPRKSSSRNCPPREAGLF